MRSLRRRALGGLECVHPHVSIRREACERAHSALRDANPELGGDQRDDALGVVEVGGREAEHLVAGADELVLALEIGRESAAMRRSVVLDDEARLRVIEVDTGEPASAGVVQVGLKLRLGQAGEKQDQPQPRLLRALRLRFGEGQGGPLVALGRRRPDARRRA